MEIREIAINHYGPLRDVKYRPRPGLQIFHGPNESGKTLLLDSILKLLLGNRLRDFAGIDRVPAPPQGRIALVLDGREHILDGSTRLDQLTELDSNYLRNIFVIRNKDLNMAGQAGFLRRVSDQLTGMEGQRLADLKDILRRQGRLTNTTSAARLSKSAEFNKIGEHVEAAETLAMEIQEYLAEAQEQELDTLERRLEDARARLRALNKEIRDQEQAEKYQAYIDLVRMIDEYEERDEAAQRLRAYNQLTLKRLQDLESRAQDNRDRALASQDKLAQLRPRLEKAQDQLAAEQAWISPLQRNKPILDDLERRMLMAAGAAPPQAPQYNKFILPLLAVTALGLFATALQPPSPLVAMVPILSFLGAAVLFLLDRTARSRVRDYQHRNRLLLQEGAGAGIMAATLQELAAALNQEKRNLEAAQGKLQILSEEVRRMQQQQEHHEEAIREASAKAEKLEQELHQELHKLGITNLEEFDERMREYNQAQTQCDELHERLEAAFGQAPDQIGNWRELLRHCPTPPPSAITFDRQRLDQLRDQKDSTQAEIDEMQGQLQSHQSALANFAAACQALPLVEEGAAPLPPHIANLEMLEHAKAVLEDFAARVRQRYANACRLLEIAEELEREEQEKMADLVGPGKPVQEIFRTVTGGRYTGISLDEELNIQVQNREGLTLPASALSQGTYDQLYLALRLSLAKDILAGEPGFLLLDDAFLCADSQRLDKLLAVLADEAAQGWQILYFTMDQRLVEAARRHTDNPPVILSPLMAQAL